MTFYLVVKETPNGLLLVCNGKTIFVEKGFNNYDAIKTAATQYNETKDKAVRKQLFNDITKMSSTVFSKVIGDNEEFELDSNGVLYMKGISEPVPEELAKMMNAGIKNKIDISAFKAFWANLFLNPDARVRKQLFGFLEHNGHPITKNGYFLVYKAVRIKEAFDPATGKKIENKIYDGDTGKEIKTISQSLTFTSIATGPYGGTIKVGEPVKMPREECNNDPNRTCSSGKMYAPLY